MKIKGGCLSHNRREGGDGDGKGETKKENKILGIWILIEETKE